MEIRQQRYYISSVEEAYEAELIKEILDAINYFKTSPPLLVKTCCFELIDFEIGRAFGVYEDNYCEWNEIDRLSLSDEEYSEYLDDLREEFYAGGDSYRLISDVQEVWSLNRFFYLVCDSYDQYANNVITGVVNSPLQSVW